MHFQLRDIFELNEIRHDQKITLFIFHFNICVNLIYCKMS